MIRAADALRTMAALPFGALSDVTGNAPILILAPHPDDESLGCGGLIAAASAAGHPPFVLVLTDGTGSHPNSRSYPPGRLRAVREQEARDAVAILGLPAERIGFMGLRDTAAPMEGKPFRAAITAILTILKAIDALTILAPWQHDPHCDHLATHRMAAAVADECGARHLAYPVWGWTLSPEILLPGPVPQGVRLNIENHVSTKQRAIAAHSTQHAGLIDDDPDGFLLPENLLDVFNQPYETFLTAG